MNTASSAPRSSLLLSGLLLLCGPSCNGPAQESGQAPGRPEATEGASVESTTLNGLRLAGASWPRLLNEGFNGVADPVSVQPNWSKPLRVAWSTPVGSGYGLGSVEGEFYYHLDAVSENFQWSERLTAFRIADGSKAWSVDRPFDYRDLYGYEAGPRGTPTTNGEVIVSFGCDGGLFCRRLTDGELIWNIDTNKQYSVVQNFFGVGSSPLLHESTVIVPVGGSPREDLEIAPGRLDRVSPAGSALVAFDLKTGKEVWRGGDDLASYSSPRLISLGGKTAVLYLARDHLIAVDPGSGKELFRHFHRADIVESVNGMVPVVDSDMIFISECYQVGSTVLRSKDGAVEVIWKDPNRDRRRQAMRCHWSTPVLVDGYLYGCSGRNNPDSDFRCVEMSTGRVMWTEDFRIRSAVSRLGNDLVVLNEKGLIQILRPNPEKFDVVAEQDFSDQLRAPCWAAPVIVGNRMFIRGDETVLCLAIPE